MPLIQSDAPSAAGLIFEINAAGDPSSVTDGARRLMKTFDSNIPVNYVSTLETLVSRNMSNEILIAQLSSFFAALALVRACIGLYGVMSYAVTGRTREIGVRMALGAQRLDVLWLVLREAIKLVIIGIVVGVPAALLSSRLFSSMLFGLKGADPASMTIVILVLCVVALFASYVPARRATKVDPIVALRYE